MATPIFKFKHPENKNEDLYFIYNTYHDALETIPMDLSTFIIYHEKNNRTLEGLFVFWGKLQKDGATLDNTNFETFFTQQEKHDIYELAINSDAIEISKKNTLVSILLEKYIQNHQFKNQNIYNFLNAQHPWVYDNFKLSNYYHSTHYLFDYLYQTNNISKNSINENSLIQLYEKNNFPLCIVPHQYRKSGFFMNECLQKNQGYLIPGYYDKLNNRNTNKVNYVDFKIHKIPLSLKLAHIYIMQLQNSNFGFSESLKTIFEENKKSIENITIDEINEILQNELFDKLPDYFYCFEKDYELLEIGNIPAQYQKIKLYTNINSVSYDEGGLVVMQCFQNQIYILCDTIGNELTPYCHDLEVGPNGLIVYRSSDLNGKWEIYTYKKVYGMRFFKTNMTEVYEYYLGSSMSYRRDLLLIKDVDKFKHELEHKNGKNYTSAEIEELLNCQEAISINSNFWFCAPWLIPYYNNDIMLALIGIEKDFIVYSLLNDELKLNQTIINKFFKHAPFQCVLVNFEYRKIKELLNTNKNICYQWLNDSHSVYEIMNENFKYEKEFIFLIAKKHHLHFYLVPKDALSNEEIIFGCLSINSMILKYLPEHLKNDKNIVEYAIKQNYNSFEFASDELKGEKQFIKQIVELTPKAIKYASDGIKNLPEFQYLVELTSNKNDFSSDINSSELPF